MLRGQLKSPKHFWSVFSYFFFGSVRSSIEENLHIQLQAFKQNKIWKEFVSGKEILKNKFDQF